MKIWIDFINSPQVSFFVPFIKQFKNNGHEVLLTCRDSGNTVELLKMNGFQYTIIDTKVGMSFLEKMLLFPRRIFELYLFIRKNKPDVAVSQSSFYQPVVARLLNIPCLYTNDNEHAKGNIFGFLFATEVLLPITFQEQRFTKKWPLKSKVSFYPSIKEAVYLSQELELRPLLEKPKSTIYFRPEPWSAQYYNGPKNFFDEILIKLSKKYKVVILPRDKNQVKHYSENKFRESIVAQKPLSLRYIISDCLLFIGAGGTMSRELAAIGIKVISIYQSQMLLVDNYLVQKGKMKVKPDITYPEIIEEIGGKDNTNQEWSILYQGSTAYSHILNKIQMLHKS